MKGLFFAPLLALLLFESVSVEAQSVHCTFGGVNHFSKFNNTRLAIMYADGIIVHSDIPARYNKSHALVYGNVSCFATINKDGKVTAIKLNESSGDKKNDETAMRLIRAASPFKISPAYEGVLNVRFTNDDDLVSVFPVETKTEQLKPSSNESP